jgi:chromosome segregation ATPase
MIRKTLSVGTFGLVSFRSTKEQLQRAERARSGAEKSLEREHAARVAAETRVSKAEKRLQHATDAALRAVEKLDRSKAKRRDERADRVRHLVESAEPAGRRARAAAKRSAREAKKGAKKTLRRAQDVVGSTKEAVAPGVERAVARAAETIDHISS